MMSWPACFQNHIFWKALTQFLYNFSQSKLVVEKSGHKTEKSLSINSEEQKGGKEYVESFA